MTWIYENKGWPHFNWDIHNLVDKLTSVCRAQGHLLGRMESLGFDLKREANLKTLTTDIVKSSAIEGQILNFEEVRSSIARFLRMDIAGLITSSRDVEGIVEMMLDATQNYQQPLTKERLFDWHAALFPTGRSGMHKITVGAWRTQAVGPMQVVSGPIGRETIHFEAPPAQRLDSEMSAFLKWFESEDNISPVLKSGLAHFWFVTIHPFEDGNGRIARAIADLAMARADNTGDRFYSVSTQIESQRKEYYKQLEKQQKGLLDVTEWLDWYLDCLGGALVKADQTLSTVLYKAQLWEQVNHQSVNERQRQIINLMLDDFKGFMNTSKYAKLTKCSTDTALRDIRELMARGVLVQNPGGGRSTSYRLAQIDEVTSIK